MTIAIMQPYLFPYLGYWQMIRHVDTFVLLDDVNFIKKGWINRNNLLLNNGPHLFSLPLDDASQNKLINEITISDNHKYKYKLLKTISQCYGKAPFFNDVFPVVESLITEPERNLSKFLFNHFKIILNYLCINTKLMLSSEIDISPELKSQDRIINICHRLKCKTYINAIGGRELYSAEKFAQEGMQLRFIKMRQVKYKQFSDSFTPGLSIIDVMMFNNLEKLTQLLIEFELVT